MLDRPQQTFCNSLGNWDSMLVNMGSSHGWKYRIGICKTMMCAEAEKACLQKA